ncbi:MAG: acetate/propionate family kinase [Candidatus Binatia bacterium]
MRVLVLNCGSSSLKFQIVDVTGGDGAPARDGRVPRGTVERIGGQATCTFIDAQGRAQRATRAIDTHEQAVREVFAQLMHGGGAAPVDAVGHRVVHGGDRFSAAARIDPEVLAEIEALDELAPLHNAASVSAIKAARETCGANVPMVAVFDTVFHRTLPDCAATYALPAELARRHRIRRYGFHGIAHSFLVSRYGEITGTASGGINIITLHLGNGCSATAIHQGRSVDTSMGFTPLEGLMMGTRCGDLDPAVVSYVARREAVAADTVVDWLNHQSGLLGVSGRSRDMRELTTLVDTDHAARLAVEMFCYRASKCVGAYLTVLGGAAALIFSGGIGENSPLVRARICERLRWCGLLIDGERNTATVGREACISSGDGLQAYVIPADEELMIGRETARCLASS